MEQAQRIFLYAALFVVAFFLWQSWNRYSEHLPKTTFTHQSTQQVSDETTKTTDNQTTSSKESANAANSNNFSNAPAFNAVAKTKTSNLQSIPKSRLIEVNTDVFKIGIDTKGGNIVSLKLKKFPVSLKEKDNPSVLLTDKPEKLYIAESALMGKAGPDTRTQLAQYKASAKSYTLTNNELKVNLIWTNPQGVEVVKTYTFKKDSYLIHVAYNVTNNSSKPWTGQFYSQLTRKNVKESGTHLFQIHPYFGAAISSPQKRYDEVSFKDMKSTPINQSTKDGWAAMVQRYFVSAWVPDADKTFHYYSKASANDIYTIGMASNPITVKPGATVTVGSKLYSGPEVTSVLKSIAPGLEQTVSYGWLWFISVIVFWVMAKIYWVVGNWGWSIILVTVLIKLIFFPLSAKSYKSMARMRGLQPKIKALRERHADDKQKQSQAMMELYKKEKVNPVGGCLPILVQIPVFFALYMVLIESVQLRQAPWILWIHDLSVPDPYFILPVLMGITMFVQQKLNPPPPDPTQAKVMMFLPVIFTVLFAYFPAGLVLYWVVNNGLSILQQWYITRKVEADEKKNKYRKKK